MIKPRRLHNLRLAIFGLLSATAAAAVLSTPAAAAPTPQFTIAASISVGGEPTAVAVDSSRNTIYVANNKSNSVSVIDGSTNSVTATLPVAGSPTAVVVDEATNTIYVACFSTGKVAVIHGGPTPTVDPNQLSVDPLPENLEIDQASGRVYVAHRAGSLRFIDRGLPPVVDPVTITLPRGAGNGLSLDPVHHTLYVNGSGWVSAVRLSDSNRVDTSLVGGVMLNAIAVDFSVQRVIVTSKSTDQIYAGDEPGLVFTHPAPLFPGTPEGVGIDQTTHTTYIGSGGGSPDGKDGISVSNSTTLDQPLVAVTTGLTTSAIAVDSLRHRAYATSGPGIPGVLTVIQEHVAQSFTNGAPAAGKVNEPYSFTMTTDASPKASFTISSGSLPTGLRLDAATGVISGTPAGAGDAGFSITASNGINTDATGNYTISISAAATVPPTGGTTGGTSTTGAGTGGTSGSGRQLASTGADGAMSATLGMIAAGLLLAGTIAGGVSVRARRERAQRR